MSTLSHEASAGENTTDGCWLCGGLLIDPIPRDSWVKPTFTNHNIVGDPDSAFICGPCEWAHSDRNVDLQRLTGKDKPQRMRNYTHIVSGGVWYPLSKGQKRDMAALLLAGGGFPELVVIAESGQKHLVFRATVNQPGQLTGWVQFEEDTLCIQQGVLRDCLTGINSLLTLGFSKAEIESGNYLTYRIRQTGIETWDELESEIAGLRGSPVFALAVFLGQKEEADEREHDAEGSRPSVGDMAPDPGVVQAGVCTDDLGSVHGLNRGGGQHGRSGGSSQLDLF